jgi:prephenate dehydrogenase
VRTVAVVGVGSIGGSFALAVRRHGLADRILGVSSPRTLAAALKRGVIDEGLPLEQAIPQADLVYLAHPISRILDDLPRLAELARPDALVTDAGSTKTAIVARAAQCFTAGRALFLGGHPMAGKAERGVEVADADLFRGYRYVLTPPEGLLPPDERVRRFCQWLERIGATVLLRSPEEHDRIVAWTSHLPQMLSTALASLLMEQFPESEDLRISANGLRDMTRLAASAPELWRDIALTNTAHVDGALSACIQKLEHLRENLRQPALREEFEQAARLLARLPKPPRDPAD